MSMYKIDQRHLNHRGRVFHFVSYEGQPANPKKEAAAVLPSWFLMGPGRRWEVMTQEELQLPEETDRCLLAWLDRHLDG